MDKDKPPVLGGGGGLPPHSSRYAGYSSPSGSAPLKRDPFPSPSSSIPAAAIPESREGAQFSHDVNRMPDYPPRNVGHRRAQSEILSLPDDINFDSDLGVVGSGEGPSLSDETEEDLLSMYLDIEKFTSSATSGFDLLGGEGSVMASHPPPPHAEGSISTSNERPRIRHQHSQSMDGYTSIKPELLASSSEGPASVETKKAVSAAKLADLALIDPKRAKRIWANRQSAARSKERKMRYIAELERKVQTLQTEATTLSAQLTLLQRDTNGLTAENNELKLRVQSMEQQVHLQDALNDALREEVQRLKVATGQPNFSNGGPLMSFGTPSFRGNQQQHFYHNNQAMQPFLAAQQLQQLQIHSQHQQQVHPYQQQPPAELKLKGAMASQTQRESTSDNSSTPSER